MAAFAQLLGLMVGAIVVPLATILLIVADTWAGRLFAVAVFFAAGTIALALFGRAPTRRRRLRLAAGIGFVGIGLVVAIARWAPPGVTVSSARVSHLTPEGGGPCRLAPTNLVPEVDQLMLGFSIMPLLDPLLTFREAGQLKASTREIYRDLEGDENFRAVGSVMGLTYTDLLGRETSNHAYLYVPPGQIRAAFPR